MRRNRTEMKYDALKAIQHKPLKLTHIMHTANINMDVLKPILNGMINQGLVEILDKPIVEVAKGNRIKTVRRGVKKTKGYYHATAKGCRAITAYEASLSFFGVGQIGVTTQ